MDEESLGQRIRRLREAKKMSLGQLSLEARCASGRQLIDLWEKGGQPGSKWIAGLADALGVSSHYLLTGHESAFVCAVPVLGGQP